MIGLIAVILICWYFIYRYYRKPFEETTGRKLTFFGVLNPKNWGNMIKR